MPDEPHEDSFKITIEGGGLSMNRTIDAERARVLINILMGGAASEPVVTKGMGGLHQPQQQQPPRSGVPISLREFLNEAQATNWPAKITAIGTYMHDNEDRPSFTRDEVRTRFRQAGEAQPGNFHRDFAVTIQNGWISEDPKNPGSHYVTNSGRKAVESKFSGEVKRAATPARRKPRAAASSEGDQGGGEE